MLKKAFTLIEMMVVIALIALLSSMIIILYNDTDEDAVSQSAIELKSVLERARSLAIKTGRMHAVSFHVENSGDGSVLKNFSDIDGEKFPGRHWYCIIGPDYSSTGTTAGYNRDVHKIPVADHSGSTALSFYCLADYIDCMKDVQIGPRHYLQPGARFLALDDSDKLYGNYSHPSYPRPWFGYYDDIQNRYYPWGAWNPDIDKSFPFPSTGLDYQGEDNLPVYDSAYDTVINPSQVWGRIHPNATAPDPEIIADGVEDTACNYYRGFKEKYLGPDTSYLASTATRKVPRPLINAYWGDYMILFDAKGTARTVIGDARATYFNMLYRWYPGIFSSRGSSENYGRRDMGIGSNSDQTGGYYITICRDIEGSEGIYPYQSSITGRSDYTKFNNVEDAFNSITPFKRVFVWRATGITEIRGMSHPQCAIDSADLLQKNPYPNGY